MGLFDFFKPKPKFPPEVDDAIKKIALVAFPGGQKQIEEETIQLHSLLRGRLTNKETGDLLRRIKSLLVISQDKSEERIKASIHLKTNGKLTDDEVHVVYSFLTGISGPVTTGGDGSSVEKAVIIKTTSPIIGVHEEYNFIERVCGKRDVDYNLEMQIQATQNGREFDILKIKMKDGTMRSFWFDISSFFRKA